MTQPHLLHRSAANDSAYTQGRPSRTLEFAYHYHPAKAQPTLGAGLANGTYPIAYQFPAFLIENPLFDSAIPYESHHPGRCRSVRHLDIPYRTNNTIRHAIRSAEQSVVTYESLNFCSGRPLNLCTRCQGLPRGAHIQIIIAHTARDQPNPNQEQTPMADGRQAALYHSLRIYLVAAKLQKNNWKKQILMKKATHAIMHP